MNYHTHHTTAPPAATMTMRERLEGQWRSRTIGSTIHRVAWRLSFEGEWGISATRTGRRSTTPRRGKRK